jgi:cytochrome b561
LSGTPEPWERWETSLVLISIGTGLLALLLLGWVVDRYLLP